ncbi:lipopolysaccharide biosynthesis protein [Pontiella agarivorans]|uniref:Membrane protein involved in the export of O-antigen and teichoic acid n=1 Tax=Pontiella agarivorans TaxID=3038953 RepID=A0ABU5MU77_9BACT|nr:hypothetical protein [Pontiella agarivorans]MDZ8117756.1 hypothetical protein [Pontiella agarivorans]
MPEFKSDSSLRRILSNGVYTVSRFGIYAISGILFIPFLVKEFGSGSYGLLALGGFLTQYIGMISSCVGTAVARYLNIALNSNDWKQANEIFTTAIVANAGFILLQLPLFALGVWKLDWLIDFPEELASDFRILVACNILLFFLNIMKGVLFTPIQAANRLDISEKFMIGSQIARMVLLFGLIKCCGARLWIVGAVDLSLSICVFLIGVSIYHKLVQENLIFKREYITTKWVKPILSMAGWSLVSMLGFSLFVKTDVWIINRFVSKEMAGVYAALLVWPNLIKQVGSVLGGLVAPVFTIDFAHGRNERMVDSLMVSAQFVAYAASLLCGIFIALAPGLIRLWLDESFIQYALWIRLLLGLLVFTISGSVFWRIFVTIGETKYMGLGNLIPGVLNISFSLLLVHFGYGALGVIYASMAALVLKENILFPFWISKEVGIPFWRFLLIYLRAGAGCVLVILVSQLLISKPVEMSIWQLGYVMPLSGLALLALIILMSTNNEKQAFTKAVQNNLPIGAKK